MHTKYIAISTTVNATLIADIAALYCGAAIADLSANCDKNTSTQVNTVPSTWTLVDAAAPQSGRVIGSPDAAGTMKYLHIYAASTVAIAFRAYETWNSATHTGTNPTVAQSINSATTMMIFGTPRLAYLATASDGMGCSELTRDALYLQQVLTYPTTVTMQSGALAGANYLLSLPRGKSVAGVGDTAPMNLNSAALSLRSTSGSSAYIASAPRYDANGAQYIEIRPLWAATGDNTIIGRVQDVYEITRGGYTIFDTFSDGVDTYMVMFNSTGCFALKVK